MKLLTMIISIFVIGGCSILFYSYMQEFIIIRYPFRTLSDHQLQQVPTTKKKVKLIYWEDEKWCTEYQELMWSDHKTENVSYLINSWLSFLEEERIMHKKVTLQAVLSSANGTTLYLSFGINPLPTECSTIKKMYWIQGLLKTLQENNLNFQSVQFLVNHKPLLDDHLDFSNSWPFAGFLPDA